MAKEQIASASSEPQVQKAEIALKRLYEALESGLLDYEDLGPRIKETTRQLANPQFAGSRAPGKASAGRWMKQNWTKISSFFAPSSSKSPTTLQKNFVLPLEEHDGEM